MDVKTCPFCNGNDVWVIRELGPKTYVQCQECGARSNTYYGERHESNAIAAWNQRVPAEAAEQRVREVGVIAGKMFEESAIGDRHPAWKQACFHYHTKLEAALQGTGSGSADNG